MLGLIKDLVGLACNLNYDKIKFSVEEKDFEKIEIKNKICINVFCYENEMVFPIHVLIKNLKTLTIYCL